MIYRGQLIIHFETGLGISPQFHDNHWNWDWTINFSHRTKLENILIYDKDGVVHYEGPWTGCRQTTENNYFPCPKELDSLDWRKYLVNQMYAVINTDEILEGLKNEKS